MDHIELESLMQQAFDDPEKIEDFYANLLSSQLYVLTEKENALEGRRILEADTEIGLINYQMDDGTLYVPVFTSLEELQNTIGEEVAYLAMDGWNLLSIVGASELILNPASEYNWRLTAEEVAKILEHFGTESLTVEEDTPVMIGLPDIDPVDLKKALSDVFERDNRVQSAYLGLMVNQENAERSIVVGVVFRPGEEYREIFKVAGPAAGKHLPPEHVLDFLVIDDEPGSISAFLLKEGDCFFRGVTQA